ncbi:hypothetical protein PV343_14610 [Streptomyces sp. WI03-4A]|uniref:hypothetical protein n=1 Tax=Streptomyces sp. WI03-4A TaxID=3028706 RepID=UPI0029BF0119|nr:hypothetical protein [Streptomyces sp. WI03-4A]MDX2593461.1 hypothetical protein [Streptomyces sp. WI03-4A]
MRYFNGTGWLAIFTGTETMSGRTVNVDAWDEAPALALVVDPRRGTRRAVTDYTDFSHLERADQVVAAIPGGGWRAYRKDVTAPWLPRAHCATWSEIVSQPPWR